MTTPTVPTFDELLDSASRTAVHLEMRDSYAVDEESEAYRTWRATGERPTDPESAYWRPWTSLVRRTVARGVTVRRTRIVSMPVSDYIRYEHAGTAVNVAAGEHVRWLPRRQTTGIALPANDFWLIDDRVICWNHFSGSGEATEPEITEDRAVARLCASAFEAVWNRATPHEEFKIH